MPHKNTFLLVHGREIHFSAHISMLFKEPPYLERASAAKQAGFTAIETWWPSGTVVARWIGEIQGAEIRVELITLWRRH